MVMDRIALLLAIIGGINWGSVGLSVLIWWPGFLAARLQLSAGSSIRWWA